jgi:hypothetical protein
MKTIATLLSIFAVGLAAFAQGTVTFNNNPATLITTTVGGNILPTAANEPGSYYYGLLISLTGAPDTFTFSGIYGTNNAAAGRFTGGIATLTGIAPGTTFYFEVAGWSASLGHTFYPNLLFNNFTGGGFGVAGVSSVGTATAGGGTPPAPPGIIFGATGLTSGFVMYGPIVPEPSTMALAALGACVLLIWRRSQ